MGDLDLLIHTEDTDQFHTILAELGFKLCAQPLWQSQPSVVHYYGCDGPTGRLLHLHVYYRLVTGGHVLKNYRLPLERLMLAQTHEQHGVVVPDQVVELAVFVIRKLLEAGAWCELALQRSDHAHLQRELDWLLPSDRERREEMLNEVTDLLARHLPQLRAATWRTGVRRLMTGSSWFGQWAIGKRFRRELRGLTLYGPIAAWSMLTVRVTRLVLQRLLHCRSRKWLAHGGRVIALVGPEASGKTTLTQSLCHWLAPVLTTDTLHLGKPSATWLGRCANGVRRLRRWLSRRNEKRDHEKRDGDAAGSSSGDARTSTLAYALASVLLARDRYYAATRAHRRASHGVMVVCDRYPSPDQGTIDGPRLDGDGDNVDQTWLHRLAARMEREYYRRIPPPDVSVQLSVPVSVAQVRNRHRVKPDKEGDAYLAERHQQFLAGAPVRAECTHVDTTRPSQEVLAELRQIVWRRLA